MNYKIPREIRNYIELIQDKKPSGITPYIIEKTKDGEAMYDVFSRLIKDRIVFLQDEVEFSSATTLAATLLWLDHQNDEDDISLYINTPGGTITDGLFTIYDTMQYVKSPVKTVCIGEAFSAGAFILASGSKGKRMAFPNAHVMIHEVQAGSDGPVSEIEKETKRLTQLSDRLFDLLARHTGNPIGQIKTDCQEEIYMTAQEALEYGIIDKIVVPNKTIPPLVQKKKNAKKTKASTSK